MIMLKYISFALMLIGMSLFSKLMDVKPDERGFIVNVGETVDDFSVTLLDGTEKKISEFKSDVLILNFFASWCAVCRKEIPYIEKEISQQFEGQQVTVDVH